MRLLDGDAIRRVEEVYENHRSASSVLDGRYDASSRLDAAAKVARQRGQVEHFAVSSTGGADTEEFISAPNLSLIHI